MADIFIEEEGLAGWVEALGPGLAAERSHQAHEQAEAWVDGISERPAVAVGMDVIPE